MRTRAASTRRASSSTATRSTACRRPTSATSKGISAMPSSSWARRSPSSSAPGAIPTRSASARPAMPLAFRLAAFYFAFFVHVSLMVAYFPPYLAARGLGPVEIGWVLALPQIARIVAPGAWGWFADRRGAQRAVVIWASALNVACFALLPHMGEFVAIAWLMALTSLVSSAALPLVDAITLGALAAQPGRYGVIRLWGSVGFIVAVLGGGAWLERYPVQNLPYAMLLFALATLGAALLLPAAHIH